MTMRCLLLRRDVDGGERIVLVDTGAGDKLTPKWQSIYGIDYSQHDLLGSLASAGVTPGQVTDVILTHLHFDHCGGATLSLGAGGDGPGTDRGSPGPAARPTFPNATYHVQRRQWEWALSPCERDRASFFPENFVPLEESGQLNLVDGEIEILPDIFLLVVHGHTPAQQLPLIRTTRRTFLYCGDLFPFASHLHLPYIMAYDLAPLKTLEEKKRVLPRAVEEEWVLFFEHDVTTECCTVEETPRGYRAAETLSLEACLTEGE
jgi:glyoxylase-like metal-dependent hydrolase (beta-lactamase superfamily II)